MSRVTIKKLREAVQRRPDDSDAWFALGVAVAESGDAEQGQQAIFQSVIVGAPNLERMLSAARMLSIAARHADAERVMRRAVECFPHREEAHIDLVRVLVDSGAERAAVQVIGNALQGHPRSVPLHLTAAAIQERMGALAEAADHLAAVLAVESEHVDANRRLAVILGRLGDSAGAVHCWRRVVTATDSKDLDSLTQLGIALSGDGQHAEAVHLLSEVAELRKDVSSVQGDLGMALLGAGRVQEAAVVWSRALEVDPESAQAYCGIGLAYQKLGRLQEAVDAFKTTELLAPDNPVGPLNLGLALESLGDREGARRALLRAAALAPDDEEIGSALESVLGHSSEIDANAVGARLDASISGDLSSFDFLDLLEFLRLQRKSGAFVVSSPTGTGTVRLVRGAVTSASAPGVKLLGETLLERGILSRADLDAVLAKQHEDQRGNPELLGTVLLREKLGDRVQLTQAVFQQVLAALEEILSWREGAFAFHPGDAKDPPAISFDLQRVMLELTRVMDERGRETKNPALRRLT